MPVKKNADSTASSKPRKASVKKKVAEKPSTEQIAQLAEQFWIERGSPIGTPELDWVRAEQELAGAHA